VTIGCISLTDDKIKELYVLSVEAKDNGQEKIPVHIFPTRLADGAIDQLSRGAHYSSQVIAFWKNLQPIYQDFERSKVLKNVTVNSKGEYNF
jgi:murein L,D-transpeptidase YafK